MDSLPEDATEDTKEVSHDLPRKKKKFTGLRYKEKQQDRPPRTQQRSRSPTRHTERRHRSRERRRDTDDRDTRTHRDKDQTSRRTDDRDVVRTKSPHATANSEYRQRPASEKDRARHDQSTFKQTTAPVPATVAPAQEMILVTVNDRLGTKKQVPCLPTDTVKDFKAIVASMIGRRPHEILLKRQSERPFKDFLTLQDYGVSHGASLDLEVDTGD